MPIKLTKKKLTVRKSVRRKSIKDVEGRTIAHASTSGKFFRHSAKPASIEAVRAAYGLTKNDFSFASNLAKKVLAHV